MFRLGRKLMFSGLLGTAVGAPYVVSNAHHATEAASGALAGMFAEQPAPQNPYALNDESILPEYPLGGAPSYPATSGVAQPVSQTALPLEGLEVHELSEVMRFDISPDWVYQRWARKSTSLSEIDLFGIRVPLVTGTKVNDLAGSLTYYFGINGQVERITFRGRTGDARPLISLMMTNYGLRRQRPRVAGDLLYEVRWNDRAMSRLRISPASVVWASVPHATYAVELDLNRPGAARYLDESRIDSNPVPVHAPLQQPRAPH